MTIANRRLASWFMLTFTALLAVILGWLFTRADQQARKHAEHARLIEARSAVILDTAPVAMIMSDIEGNITYCNPQAEELFGWSSEEIIGQPVYKILTEETAKEHKKRFAQAVARIKSQEGAWQFTRRVEGHALTKDGKSLHVSVAVRGIKYNGYVEFVAVIHPTECLHEGEVIVQPFDPKKVGRTLPNAFKGPEQQER